VNRILAVATLEKIVMKRGKRKRERERNKLKVSQKIKKGTMY
jgi:hypothetical protein